jgi:hypothetical protein
LYALVFQVIMDLLEGEFLRDAPEDSPKEPLLREWIPVAGDT